MKKTASKNLETKKSSQLQNVEYIEVMGAHAHNLKNINIKIPRGKIVAFTGKSG